MRALLSLSIYIAFFTASAVVHAEPLALPLTAVAHAQDMNHEIQGPAAFLNTTLVLDPSGVPSGWMLAPVTSGASSCESEESTNCLTSADLVSRLDPVPSVGQGDPIRNNLPEPATWLMLAGGIPLLWGRMKSLR